MSSRSVAGQVAAIVLRVLCELVNARTGSPPRTGPRPKSTCLRAAAGADVGLPSKQWAAFHRFSWAINPLSPLASVCGHLVSRAACDMWCMWLHLFPWLRMCNRVRKLFLRRACTAMLLTVRTCMDAEVRKPFPTCTHALTHARTGISGRYEEADWLVVGGC